jgi:hypothetical protein
LKLQENAELLRKPILLPPQKIDAEVNYECRIEYILRLIFNQYSAQNRNKLLDKFGYNNFLRSILTNPILVPSYNPTKRQLYNFYIERIDPHSDILINICLFSTALFYAPHKMVGSSSIRGTAAFLLTELMESNPEYSKEIGLEALITALLEENI